MTGPTWCLLVLLVGAPVAAQPEAGWGWGWSQPDTTWAEDALLHTLDGADGSFGERAIGYYQTDVAPRMGRPCPAWPSCSMYTRYAVARWGLAAGTLMGIDRLFFRENAAFTGGRTAFTVRLDGRTRIYDPPDATVASALDDWRRLHPDYRARFHRLRAKPSRHDAGSAGPGRRGVHVPGQ